MSAFTLAALKSELQNDPTAIGLTTPFNAGSDGVCVSLLNTPNVGISVKRVDITPNELLEAIAVADFAASVPTITASWFESLTQLRTVRLTNDDGSDTVVLANLKTIVTGSASRTRLATVSTKVGSRAEQLWGAGFQVTALNISDARAS